MQQQKQTFSFFPLKKVWTLTALFTGIVITACSDGQKNEDEENDPDFKSPTLQNTNVINFEEALPDDMKEEKYAYLDNLPSIETPVDEAPAEPKTPKKITNNTNQNQTKHTPQQKPKIATTPTKNTAQQKPKIAITPTKHTPQQKPQIATTPTKHTPQQKPQIATTPTKHTAQQKPKIAATPTKHTPQQKPKIATTPTKHTPQQKPKIATAPTKHTPQQKPKIATTPTKHTQQQKPQIATTPTIPPTAKLQLGRKNHSHKFPKINLDSGELNYPKQQSATHKTNRRQEYLLRHSSSIILKPLSLSSHPKVVARSQYKTSVSLMNTFCQETGRTKIQRPKTGDTAYVTHEEATAFLQWLTQKHRSIHLLSNDAYYRLPSSSEVKSKKIWLCDKVERGVKSFGFVKVKK